MSTKTSTPKFQTILASTGQEVLDKRAQAVFKATSKKITDHIANLEGKIDDLDMQILDLTDLSVETKDSLRPGAKGYNAGEWVGTILKLKMEIALLNDELAIANEVYVEFFSTEEVV